MTASEDAHPADPAPALQRGQTIGRYVVLGLVGRGGMGEVYAAYDPELDRKIAVKLLRAGAGAAGRGTTPDSGSRLLREAQAIAKLSHPNVVVVHDVGTFRDSVFLAMEFIEGQTVGQWLRAAPRSWREVLQVFLAAGRGLAAAHAAGLVHRDFKPENVMVSAGGQVRVTDFGLARQVFDDRGAEGTAAPAPVGERPAALSSSYLHAKLTQTGALVGTPAYMAAEQFAGRRADARTDQFSFCVALYEGLYGRRPFSGENVVQVMTRVVDGVVDPAPDKTRVPAWLRKVLLRGLRPEPAQRFPSMAALIDALETDPRVRMRRVAGGAVMLGAALAVALVAQRLTSSRRAMCAGGPARLAGIWEPGPAPSARKQAVRDAFAATGRSYAGQAFAGVTRLLDPYTARWTAMYADACQATHVRGEQSEEVLDLRMGCLRERLMSVRALTDLFVTADATVVENAVSAAAALPGLDRCADVPLLKAVVKPPADEATRLRVEELRSARARFVALRDAGQCAAAKRMSEGLVKDVRAAGYLPLLADTLNAVGLLGDQCTDAAASVGSYLEAHAVALQCRHDEAAAQAAVLASGLIGDRTGRSDEAREWLRIGRALIARIGGHPLLEAWAVVSEGAIVYQEGKPEAAIALDRRALAAKEKLLGKDNPDTLSSLQNLATVLGASGHNDEALQMHARTQAEVTRVLGPEHPKLAMSLSNEGELLNSLRRYPEARRSFQRAIDIWRRAGADPFFVAYALTGLGLAYLGEQRPAEAVPPLEEALRTRTEKHVGAEQMGEARFALAQALWSRPADRERARSLALQAREDYRSLPGTSATARTALAAIEAWTSQR